MKAPAIVRALRPHQWAKNVLVFVPLLLGHRWDDPAGLRAALLAFLAFSVTASAVYVINDLLDIEADRQHPTKKTRPFAAGTLRVAAGPPLAVLLLGTAGALSATLLPWRFSMLLLGYAALAIAYSLWLKRLLLVDVFALTSFYVLRLLGGAYATGTPLSEWLPAFAGFLLTSLAFAKRYAELAVAADANVEQKLVGRAYHVVDLSVIETVGPTSGYMAVLVLALYINSSEVAALYENPVMLWLVCPVVLFWITRLWFLAKRRQLHEDPVIFALTDRTSLVAGMITAVLAGLAMQGWGPSLP